MSIPFSRSMRSLETDGFRASALGLLLVAVLMSLWIAWLFQARVTLYEASETACLTSPEKLAAEFSPAALAHLRVGQAAQVRLDAFPWTQYGALAATLENIGPIRDGRVQVEFALRPAPDASIPLQAALRGRVEGEAGRVSPFALIMRAAGQ